jgi:hypothetical protein
VADEQLPIEVPTRPERDKRPIEGRRANRISRAVAADPLSIDQARALLASSSVVRDPVHHDIRVTKFEFDLIDSPAFQRLRLINQLAMVDLVYPGAVHTRFLHSLGTLHVCAELIEACNNSVKALRPLAAPGDPVPVRIPYYAEFLARLVALLHDMAHVPFGHVFEREAQVFEKDEWEDPWRLQQTLGDGAPFAATFQERLTERLVRLPPGNAMSPEDATVVARRVLSEVREIVTAKGADVLRLRYPFVADLVGNTICSDLLDYVQRDMYFCGLTEGLAKRFLTYMAIVPARYAVPDRELGSDMRTVRLEPVRDDTYGEFAKPVTDEGKNLVGCRAVFVYYRYNQRKAAATKGNVLAEAIDLVRTRKLLAEKLYFHKTKLTATSMLAAAAHASGVRSAEVVWGKSDHEVLCMIGEGAPAEGEGSERSRRRRRRAAKIAQDLLARRLFKPIFRLSWHPDNEDPVAKQLWHPETGAYARFSSPNRREELIELIELAIEENVLRKPQAAAGTVSISCPNKEMQLKPFEMLVLALPTDSEVRTLEETVKPTVMKEIEVIKTQHEELWRLEVFVDQRAVDFGTEFAQRLAGAIERSVGMRNELPEFRQAPSGSIDDLIRLGSVDAALEARGLTERITKAHYSQLVTGEIAARGVEAIDGQLREWKYIK